MPMGTTCPTSRAKPNHGGFANPTTTDSWVEGFATFYAMWTKRDKVQESNSALWYDQGRAQNLEVNYLAWNNQDEELAVAGLLWDLLDPIEPLDATAMPVVPNPAGVVAVTANATFYGDHVQVDSADLVELFVQQPSLLPLTARRPHPRTIATSLTSSSSTRRCRANGVGLTLPATAQWPGRGGRAVYRPRVLCRHCPAKTRPGTWARRFASPAT